jgi:ribosomal protein S18 acetylase RimI-like enzyme
MTTADPPGSINGRHPLDNPVFAALRGPHQQFAECDGAAMRYDPAVAAFAAVADPNSARDWHDAARLVGPHDSALFVFGPQPIPSGWRLDWELTGVQMTGEAVSGRADPETVPLTGADVDEMLDLVARTRPGPFLPRTIELGRFLGIRRHGALVAMTGQRMHAPGWIEVSAVCTDDAFRGQGLAARLVRAVCGDIQSQDAAPFLHVTGQNVTAIRLYERLGFTARRPVHFRALRAPTTEFR